MSRMRTSFGPQLAVRLVRLLVMFGVVLIGYAVGLDLGNTVVLVLLAVLAVGVGHVAGEALARSQGWRPPGP